MSDSGVLACPFTDPFLLSLTFGNVQTPKCVCTSTPTRGEVLTRAAPEFKEQEKSKPELSCVLSDKGQAPSLISTQEISLGRRRQDNRAERAFRDGKRKRRR